MLEKQEQYDAACEKYQEALRLELQPSKSDYRRRSKLLNDVGVVLSGQEKHNEALEYQRQSLAIDFEHAPDDHLNIGTTYRNMASN